MNEKFLLFFLNSFPSKKTGEMLYQITTKPKKQFNVLGISFSVSEWSPAMATSSDVITSGFANDISEADWVNLKKEYPDERFYMDINSDPTSPNLMSVDEYKNRSVDSESPRASFQLTYLAQHIDLLLVCYRYPIRVTQQTAPTQSTIERLTIDDIYYDLAMSQNQLSILHCVRKLTLVVCLCYQMFYYYFINK